MISPDSFSYEMDIYASGACWRGELSEANSRRISDILNNRGSASLVIERSRLITWDDGIYQDCGEQGTQAVFKRNILAVVMVNAAKPTTFTNSADRIKKISRRIAIYAPPISVTGKFHLPPGAELIAGIEASQQDFLPLTSASLQWLDKRAPLPNSTGLIFVNRALIVCVQELATDPSDATPPPMSLEMLTRAS